MKKTKNKKIKIDINWELQPAHGSSKTFLHDGKMYIKVGPVNDDIEIRFISNGIQSVVDKLEFDNIDDTYSYYNQLYVHGEKEII